MRRTATLILTIALITSYAACKKAVSPPPPNEKQTSPASNAEADKPRDPFDDSDGIFFGNPNPNPRPIPELRNVPDEKAQRARSLHLVTVKLKGTLAELQTEILKQTGLELRPGEVDMTRTVDLDVRDWPIRRVLHKVNVDAKYGSLEDYTPNPGIQYAEGICLEFTATPWAPEGKRLGWIVMTDARVDEGYDPRSPDVIWDIGSIEAKGPVAVERCGLHSPKLVYVPLLDPGPLTVKAKGTRSWYLDVPIEFRNPKPDDIWEGHGFRIGLSNWPQVDVRSTRPLPKNLLEKCLSSGDVAAYLKDRRKERYYDTIGIGGGSGGGGRYGGRFGGREKVSYAWCGCLNEPSKVEREAVQAADQFTVKSDSFGETLSAVQLVRIYFRALIVEEFEVTSDPLKLVDR